MSHTLTFSQLVGEFLTDKELLGAQDPYVVFQIGSQKSQTKAIKSAGAGSAEWKETYTLNEFSPNAGSNLEVTVYNHNTLRPDGTLGSGTVDLSNLGESQLSGSGDKVRVPLTDKKGKNVGTLSFIIHGGGYTGSRGTGSGVGQHTGSGHHTGAGIAGAGAAAAGAAGAGHHHGHHHGHHGTGTGENVTGVGAGSNYGTAKTAADKAAAENRDVTIQGRSGEVAAGRPVGTGTGVTDTSRETTGYTDSARGTGAGEVIDRKYYTGTENRPQEQALVEQYREHNPYAKQYETTVQHTGRERLVGSSIEALGTTERVVGQDHHVHTHPHDHIARALPKGAVNERPGGEGWVQGKAGPVCDSTTFEVTGDRTVDKERVTNLREHREFEKEFEVKTALKGERNLERGAETEQLNRERVLLDEKNKVACEGHPSVEAGGVRGSTGTTGYGSGTGTGTGTGYGSGTRDTTSGYGSGTGATGGSGYGTGTGATEGSGYGTGTGATGGSGYGTGTGATGGSGYGTGTGATGGSGYGTGTGATGTSGTSGYGTGTGTGQNPTAGMTTTQKLASFVPGTEANKEKKAAQGTF